jgi:biofilm PGA synthesis N-glycosyltransferase PgaC
MTFRIKRNIWRKFILYAILYLVTVFIVVSVLIFHPYEHNVLPWLRTIIIVFATILLTKYFTYMVISPWYDVWKYWNYHYRLRQKVRTYKPKVSVMIPAWNEEVGILATIKSLLKSTYHNIELVVINDGSTDGSHSLISDFLAHYEGDIPIVYHYQLNGGKGSALNKAIGLSHGELLVSIDADCAVDPNAIKHFVRYFADPKVMAAVGNVKIGNTGTVIGVVQYLEFLFSFYFKKADSLFNAIYIIGGAAGAFRRKIFDTLGGYSIGNITEDIELSLRIQDAGMKIVYAADAVVYTEGAIDISGLRKQRLRWKRGRFQTFHHFRHLFFSMKPIHQKILTCGILPLALVGDLQLFLEPIFLLFLYIYSFITRDYSSFVSGIIVVSTMFLIQIFFDDRKNRRWSFYILFPIGWLLFYLTTIVEYSALIKSGWLYIRKQEVTWQRWKRKGVMNKSV